MNVRRQLYKKYRLEGYSAYSAAVKAGYSKNTAKNARKYMENNGDFSEILEQAGLTDTFLAKHAEKGINATKDNGNPDWHARHKYYETSLKLRNKVKEAESGEKTGSTKVIIIRESASGNQDQRGNVPGSVSVLRV